MKQSVILIAVALIFVTYIFADVPPGPGQAYVPVSLRVELADDFPEYRFFIDSPMDVEEIFVTKSAPADIDGEGRNGAKRFGTLIAIPKKSLAALGDKPPSEQLNALDESLKQKKIEGVIELTRHEFRTEVSSLSQTDKLSAKTLIERDAELGLKAKLISSGGGKIDFGVYGVSKSFTPLGYFVCVGVPLFVIATIILGIWLIRRKKSGSLS